MPSPQMNAVIQILKAQSTALTDAPTITQTRAAFEQMAAMFPLPADVKTEAFNLDGIPAEWVSTSSSQADLAFLWLHGGAYAIGSIASHRELASRIARASGARVLLIDYRLAPENPFPAALEDACKAYRWLLRSGFAPSALTIGGDSAGGGLTLAALMALRDAGEPLPAAAVCMSPWVDLEGTGASAQPGAVDDPILRADGLSQYGKMYAGDNLRNSGASPLYGSFAKLPPLLIQVGTREILLDDGRRIIDLARSAGVDVTAEIEEGLIHVWQFFGPQIPETVKAMESVGAFLKKHVRAAAAAGLRAS